MDYNAILESFKESDNNYTVVQDPNILGKTVAQLNDTPYEIHENYGIEHRIIVAADEFKQNVNTDVKFDRAAEDYLSNKGYSVGRMQFGAPRGIVFNNNVSIMKWRNLDDYDKERLDAILVNYADKCLVYYFKMPE